MPAVLRSRATGRSSRCRFLRPGVARHENARAERDQPAEREPDDQAVNVAERSSAKPATARRRLNGEVPRQSSATATALALAAR